LNTAFLEIKFLIGKALAHPFFFLSRLIPGFIRVLIKRCIVRIFIKRIIEGRETQNGPIAVAGMLRATLGLGQGARLYAQALAENGFGVRKFDLTKKFRQKAILAAGSEKNAQPGEGGLAVIQLNPPELPAGLFAMGRRLLKGKKIIGYWTWEMPKIPEDWKIAFDLVDEIWVPTRFVAGSIQPQARVCVRAIPYPVRTPIPSALGRSFFRIPDPAFVCLTLCDMQSSAARKNPVGAIRAFQNAFGSSSEALLVVKISNPDGRPGEMAKIRREAGDAPNIRFIEQLLDAGALAALLQCADVILSLHRSEGFGLVLAEAMALGKAVVATGWSGNMDFMNPSNSIPIGYNLVAPRDPQNIYKPEWGNWAEPDLSEASAALRKLHLHPDFRFRIGEEGKKTIQDLFSPQRFRESIQESLDGFGIRCDAPANG
jgi:glycosyltransferase involved in cell wall biosynthesis